MKALREYGAQNMELPAFYALQEVRYRIDLDASGRFLTRTALHDSERPTRGPRIAIPNTKRTSNIVPLPLDKGEYVFGLAPPGADHTRRSRAARAHQEFLDLLRQAAQETGLDSFHAIHGYASSPGGSVPSDWDPGRFIAIYVDGALPTDNPVSQKWWAERQRASAHGGSSATATPSKRACGVCGALSVPAEQLTTSVRGLSSIGGQALMALVIGKSPNQEVFERHGMKRATGAGVCADCGNAIHETMSQLIGDATHSIGLGSSRFIWWATEPVADFLNALVSGDTSADVADTLDSIRTGKRRPADASSRFVGISLGANSSRVVVRGWIDITLDDAFSNIRRWFGRVQIVDRQSGGPASPPSVFAMLRSVAPPGQGSPLSRLDPGLPDAVLTAALGGSALPPSLLIHVLGRIRAGLGQIAAPTAALLKACITPISHSTPEDHMSQLDAISIDAAYRCGRLLALLDDAARLATTANNALVDRSYAAASTMPEVTFTRLLRLHRHHLDKLRRDKPGAATRIDASIAEILDGLDEIPRTLSPEEQARFALGLYHQQAEGRRATGEARKSKLLADASDADDGTDLHKEES